MMMKMTRKKMENKYPLITQIQGLKYKRKDLNSLELKSKRRSSSKFFSLEEIAGRTRKAYLSVRRRLKIIDSIAAFIAIIN